MQVYAEDLDNAVWQSFALDEQPTKFRELRLARNLDPAKPFTEKKEVSVLATGATLTLADILTSEFEVYDSLPSVHALLTTLNGDANFAKFAWILQWPKLKDEEKRAKYSEFACHELNFFLARKDAAFFEQGRPAVSAQQEGQDLHGRLPARERPAPLPRAVGARAAQRGRARPARRAHRRRGGQHRPRICASCGN